MSEKDFIEALEEKANALAVVAPMTLEHRLVLAQNITTLSNQMTSNGDKRATIDPAPHTYALGYGDMS